MAETTIEWTSYIKDGRLIPGYSFNPWEGCSKVSEGCTNCYAEARAHRYDTVKWGPQGTRRIASESYWRQPLTWNRKAEQAGERRRVFCASLADVFEDRPELEAPRRRLWELIVKTPNLDWLLLTKRPENISRMLGPGGINFYAVEGPVPCPQPNVWLGTSVENQKCAEERIPLLLDTPAAVRFLSMEPLLESVDLERIRGALPESAETCHYGEAHINRTCDCSFGVDWVIVGGESGGKNRREFHLEWSRDLLRQCREANVPYFFKQAGSNPYEYTGDYSVA